MNAKRHLPEIGVMIEFGLFGVEFVPEAVDIRLAVVFPVSRIR
jgi:hypothetical protein